MSIKLTKGCNDLDYALHLIAIRMDAFDNFTKLGCARAVILNQLLLTEEALIHGEFGDYELLKNKLTLLIKEDAELADLVTANAPPRYSLDNRPKNSPAFG